MAEITTTFCDNCGEECGSVTAGGQVHIHVWVNHGKVLEEDWVFCGDCVPTPFYSNRPGWYEKVKQSALSMVQKLVGAKQESTK